MDLKTRLSGLDELLAIIYGSDTHLETLLHELGFAKPQVEQLQDGHLESLVTQFLEVIHKRLTSDSGKDTYYQILGRRYGLDGEPQEQLASIAARNGFSPAYLRQLFDKIIQRCQSKLWQKELKTSLKHLAVAELGQRNERPTRRRVAEKLERLTNLHGALDITHLDYESKRAEILKQVQAELDALDLEYRPLLEAAEDNIAALENEIKTDVLLYGETVSGGQYRASYTRGRVSWDNEGITKYAASHPEVLQFRKQGQPIVSLRIVNKE